MWKKVNQQWQQHYDNTKKRHLYSMQNGVSMVRSRGTKRKHEVIQKASIELDTATVTAHSSSETSNRSLQSMPRGFRKCPTESQEIMTRLQKIGRGQHQK